MTKIIKLGLLLVVASFTISYAKAQTIATIGLDTLHFDSKSSSAQTPENLGEISATVSRQLKQQLLATRKFKVLNYAEVSEILADQGLSVETITDNQTDEVIEADAVDYILSASVVNLDTRVNASSPIELNLTLRPTADFLSEINSSTTISPDQQNGLAATLSSITSALVTEVVASVFPVRVIGIDQEGVLTMNYGSGVLQRGDQLEILSPIKKNNNGAVESGPAKGASIARIEITEVNKKFASAKVLEGTEQIDAGYKAKRL